MKRLIVFAVLIGLLLCGCGKNNTPPTETVPQTQPVTEPTIESIPATPTQPVTEPTTGSDPTTPPPTEDITEPTQPEVEKVTVYLLTEMTVFDSGSTEYHYDDSYNIDSYKVFTVENTTMYEAFFEDKDANGMACVVRTQWPEDVGNEPRNLTYFEDGKLKDEQIVGSNFSGFQYEYDQKGDRTEKREYYDGILQSIVHYEYDGEVLKAVYCEDIAGNKLYECRIRNGLITEKIFYDSTVEYSYRYEYDANNNLVKTTFCYDGEDLPGDQYFYKAVEVDAERAHYLLEQQKYLISVT